MRRTLFLKHLKTILHSLEVTYSLPVQPIVLPAGSENLQQFASSASLSAVLLALLASRDGLTARPPVVPTDLFPGRDDSFGNAGGSNGTLSGSPYRNLAPPFVP
jgi:hypothetical protein